MPVVTRARLNCTYIDYVIPGRRIFHAFEKNKTPRHGGLDLQDMNDVLYALLALSGQPIYDLTRAQLRNTISVRRFANNVLSAARMHDTVTINSMSNNDYRPSPRAYLVSRTACTCPDFRIRPAGARGDGDLCKHQVEAITLGLI